MGARKQQIKDLIAKMNNCPICAQPLGWFGSVGGEYKSCPSGCGIMRVHGKTSGQTLGLIFELNTP